MNALAKAQFEYDNRLPVELDTDAERIWIDDAAEQLLLGADVKFKRSLHSPQGVTYEQFAAAVDEFVMGQLSATGISNSVLGRLVLAAKRRASSDACTAAAEALNSPNPDEALRQIAITLLTPMARDALIAQAEDAEL
ncbi:hypothetical protein OKW98_18645 [Pseudomonas sp. KU26590]|uniref:hypothetical protein n=1 Tax=Pseudomonas sp. KU26590 TaxID=2991051 RepID=UPI00223E8123|nr:hypothetical protein [Pseudomonas sp. KU26590]UZJ58597.1 hypothetical protein OKW98_18645 [Pseudomonas sp. KU26590]